jgi:hypothetical protein
MLNWILKHFSTSPTLFEVPSPKPRFTQAQADQTVSMMVGILKEGSLALPIADTGSEDPIADAGHFFISEPLTPEDAKDLTVGDWIITKVGDALRAHHIKSISLNPCWTAVTRGTNCIRDDPEKTYPSDLKYLIRGVLY